LLSGIFNSLYYFGSLSLFTRYSRIVYDGEEVKIFGIAKYNKFYNIWEITKPIAIMKEGFEKVISHLSRK
jgi:hypothetical protein